jgi:hypothetical protein
MVGASNANILYEARNLSFDRTNYIDTGVYLFSEENINKNFEFIATGINGTYVSNEATIICAKHNGRALGFLVRIRDSNDSAYKGTIYVMPKRDNYLIIRRINGVLSVEGEMIKNRPSFNPNTVFNHPLVLGCALEDNGNPYRYGVGTIGHVLVRWL